MRLVLLIVWLSQLPRGQTLAPRPADATRTGAFASPELRESSGIARSRPLPLGQFGTPVRCNVAGLEPEGEGVEWPDGTRLIPSSEAIAGRGAAPIHVVRSVA